MSERQGRGVRALGMASVFSASIVLSSAAPILGGAVLVGGGGGGAPASRQGPSAAYASVKSNLQRQIQELQGKIAAQTGEMQVVEHDRYGDPSAGQLIRSDEAAIQNERAAIAKLEAVLARLSKLESAGAAVPPEYARAASASGGARSGHSRASSGRSSEPTVDPNSLYGNLGSGNDIQAAKRVEVSAQERRMKDGFYQSPSAPIRPTAPDPVARKIRSLEADIKSLQSQINSLSGRGANTGVLEAIQRESKAIAADKAEIANLKKLRAGILMPGTVLKPVTIVRSQNGRYYLAMQGDGNLVVYTSGARPLFASNTDGRPGAYAVMQADGNLVIYLRGRAIWASGTDRHPGAFAVMQNDGNFVIYQKSKPLWASQSGGLLGGQAPGSAPAPAPAPVSGGGSVQQIIQSVFAPLGQNAVNLFTCIAKAESGGNPNICAGGCDPAVCAGYSACGLFQFEPQTWSGTPYSGESRFNPLASAQAAAWEYRHNGVFPWCGDPCVGWPVPPCPPSGHW